MRALVASPHSEEYVEIREVPGPSPMADDAVVRVEAISLNRGEVNRLASAQDGTVFGWDFAGTVVREAEGNRGPRAGARVVGFMLGGAWTERVAVRYDRLAELPDSVTFAAAATLPVAGLTALRVLRYGGLLLGKRVLVTGAAGGVGHFAIQLAARAGAHITAVVGSEERGKGLEDLGAQEIAVGPEGLAGEFDLILESAGGSSLAAALGLVSINGTIVTFGNSARTETTFNVSNFYNRAASLQGFILLGPWEQHDIGKDLGYLASLLASGELKAEVSLEQSWKEAPAALRALRERQVRGKAVLRID